MQNNKKNIRVQAKPAPSTSRNALNQTASLSTKVIV